MTFENPSDDVIRTLLTDAKVIALVGASPSPAKPSHGVMGRLLRAGYRVIPVNPNEREVLGQPCVASLTDIHEPVDIVDVFRRPEHTPPLAREAVQIKAKAFWLQEGIVNDEAAAIAKDAGLIVVMDRCVAVELAVLRVKR